MSTATAAKPAAPYRTDRERSLVADVGKRGFRSLGEFANVVRNNSHGKNIPLDPRLIMDAAPNSAGSEASGADGGFSVPPDFADQILIGINADDSLMRMCDVRFTTSNSITIPKDESTPWQSSGGIQVAWESQLGQLSQSKPQLTSATLKLNKLTALIPCSDELLDDAPSLGQHIAIKAPQKIAFAVEQAIINGTGVGEPLGILNSAATITVAEESGQTAATVTYQNILKLWNRVTPSARKRGTWIINDDVDLQLQQLVIPGTAGNVSAAGPIYQPPSALAPFGSLLGRPLFVTEASPGLGNRGDIVFGDLSEYLVAAHLMRQDVSVHLWFDYDITAFRFILRMTGQPFGSAVIPSLQAGAPTRSFFTTLATRS